MAVSLLVLGNRTNPSNNANDNVPWRQSRIVALDPSTRSPVEALWQYENESDISQGDAFFDVKPQSKLTVSANGYDPVTLNPINIGVIRDMATVVIDNEHLLSQWGNASFTDLFPIDPVQNHDAKSITPGTECVMVLRSDSSLYCWGNPHNGGQLKPDTATRTDITKVISNNGTGLLLGNTAPYVETWGYKSEVQFLVPESIAEMDNVTDIIANPWGAIVLNASGQVFALGVDEVIPDEISALSDITSIICATNSNCALRATGQVVAWGIGADSSETVPDDIAALTDIVRVFPGRTSYIALRANGSIVAWGDDWDYVNDIPDNILSLTNIVDIHFSTGTGLYDPYGSWVVLCADGSVFAWGDPSLGITNVPADLKDVASLNIAYAACSALHLDGHVTVWGIDFLLTDTPDNLLENVQAVYLGKESAVAIKSDNTLVCWGDPSSGGDMNQVPEGIQGNISYLSQS